MTATGREDHSRTRETTFKCDVLLLIAAGAGVYKTHRSATFIKQKNHRRSDHDENERITPTMDGDCASRISCLVSCFRRYADQLQPLLDAGMAFWWNDEVSYASGEHVDDPKP